MGKIIHTIRQSKVLLTGTVLLLVILVAILIGPLLKPHEETIQGQVETTDYRVSTKVPSRVVRILVKEGDIVHKGDTVAVLSSPELDATEQGAVASMEASEAMKDLTDNGSRREAISAAYQVWQQAKAHEVIARQTWMRIEKLYSEGVVSQQRRDEAKAAFDATGAATRAARSHYELVLEGSRHEEKRIAASHLKAKEAKVDEVRSLMRETVLTATQGGRVTEVFLEPGELAGTGAPILNIDTGEYWFTFFVTEDKLPNLQVGMKVKVFVPSCGQTVKAIISRMNHEGDFAAWKATGSLEGTDLKVFEVRARPEQSLRKGLDGASAMLIF